MPNEAILNINFDIVQVVQRSNMEDMEDNEEMDYADGEGVDNIELQVEIVKNGSKMIITAELDNAVEPEEEGGSGKSELFITDIRIDQGTSDKYQGPDFNTLDEELQQSIQEYVTEQLGDLNALAEFIDAYSASKEGQQYGQWLEKARSVFE